MALTPTESAEYTASQTQDKVQGIADGGKVRCLYAKYTATAVGTGEATMGVLPQGRVLIHRGISRVITSGTAFTATADLHVGHGAYTQQDGTAVVADDNEWLDNADAGGGALDSAFTTLGDPIYNSRSGIPVTITVDTANIGVGSIVELFMYYSQEN